MGTDKAPLPLQGLHFWYCWQFSVGRSIHSSEGPDHCKLTNEWTWQVMNPERLDEEYLAEVSC